MVIQVIRSRKLISVIGDVKVKKEYSETGEIPAKINKRCDNLLIDNWNLSSWIIHQSYFDDVLSLLTFTETIGHKS